MNVEINNQLYVTTICLIPSQLKKKRTCHVSTSPRKNVSNQKEFKHYNDPTKR